MQFLGQARSIKLFAGFAHMYFQIITIKVSNLIFMTEFLNDHI